MGDGLVAIKEIWVSDLTGEEIGAEERLARIVVDEHPALPDSVTLDVLPDEVEGKLPEEQTEVQNFVWATYYPSAESGGAPRTFVLSVEEFNNLSPEQDMETVLLDAHRAQQAEEGRRRARREMRLIDRLYQQAANTPSDIWEHIPLLREIAEQYRHVTEFGARFGVSTVALLAAEPDVFITYDREPQDSVKMLETAAKNLINARFEYRIADVREIEIEPTDFLFIDTWHIESQMDIELRRHADKVHSVIGFHDTETFGVVGESPGHRGIWYAIDRFLKEHPEWEIREQRANNNGLTLIGRRPGGVCYYVPESREDRFYSGFR